MYTVLAADLKDVNANVPANSANSGAAVNPQLPLKTSDDSNAHLPPVVSHDSNADTKLDSETLKVAPVIIPTIIPTIKPTEPPTKPTTKATTTSTTSTTTPTPTTTAAPTTPAPTTPLPPPSTGKWTVKENNTLCIIVQVAAQFNVSYTNAKNVTIHKAMDIPSNGTATGKCGSTEQNLTLSWTPQAGALSQDNFTLHFVKNETDKRYSLHHLEISLASEEFPNDKSNKTVTLVHVAPQFSTGLSNSYRCLKEQTLNLTLLGRNETVGQLKVSDLQFQAFRGDNTTVFGLAKDCSFNTPDIVPITVGCALAVLVVIVLIVYLVGRRRSQARGYLSM
ncbi:Lysosome-associated membrane glycoprotein [Ooceraea biroi]|uniref:Lysosome-associated membrane glycoprotein 5 n=1 Tax=Ooceraea biroi TaxID=2015173 RepID=A0A026WQB8_OOCBI|nr:Lysosome-associated membrane glycoprotein [Ooceraea biroi]